MIKDISPWKEPTPLLPIVTVLGLPHDQEEARPSIQSCRTKQVASSVGKYIGTDAPLIKFISCGTLAILSWHTVYELLLQLDSHFSFYIPSLYTQAILINC